MKSVIAAVGASVVGAELGYMWLNLGMRTAGSSSKYQVAAGEEEYPFCSCCRPRGKEYERNTGINSRAQHELEPRQL